MPKPEFPGSVTIVLVSFENVFDYDERYSGDAETLAEAAAQVMKYLEENAAGSFDKWELCSPYHTDFALDSCPKLSNKLVAAQVPDGALPKFLAAVPVSDTFTKISILHEDDLVALSPSTMQTAKPEPIPDLLVQVLSLFPGVRKLDLQGVVASRKGWDVLPQLLAGTPVELLNIEFRASQRDALGSDRPFWMKLVKEMETQAGKRLRITSDSL
jgi:hypothetical protein